MTVTIKLNVSKLVNTNFELSQGIAFSQITDKIGFASAYSEATTIIITQSSSTKSINVSGITILYDNNRVNLAQDEVAVTFTGWFNESTRMEQFLILLELGIVTIENNETTMVLYRLNDKRETVSKSLTRVSFITGTFKAPLGIKNVEIDVINYNIDNPYNYVWIPKLNRYYYITNIQFVTKDLTRLILQEDVLMSHSALIRQQTAYITRYENATVNEIVDERLPLDDKITTEEIFVTDTSSGSLVNVTLDYNNYYVPNVHDDYPNIMITSFSTKVSTNDDNYYLSAPSGSGLPDISAQLNDYERVTFIRPRKLFYLTLAYMSDDAVSSYIESVIRLPFNATNAFGLTTNQYMAIFVRDKYIDQYGEYVPYDSPTATPLETYQPDWQNGKRGAVPYLIIKDFTYSHTSTFDDLEPYANYEIYIPFVGWIQIPSYKFFNKRILIYYSMDAKTGMATAYIYNYTNKYIIWSGTCQLGTKIDMTATNQIENIRQKQSNDMNMLLGLLSSAVSIGVGAYSGNSVAVVGGVLSGGKAIASYVNANNQIFERAQISFGSSNGCIYAPKKVMIRKSYHARRVNVTDYHRLEGKPYNSYSTLTGLTGYVEIGDINFDAKGNNIYGDEITEIVQLLKSGVIL